MFAIPTLFMIRIVHCTLICIYTVSIFSSCTSQTHSFSLIGKFTSEKYNFFEKGEMALNKEKYVLNSELTLSSDSTYQLSTCGNLINGHWKVSKDSLFLFCEQNIYKKESLYEKGSPTCSEKPTVFYIYPKSRELKLIGVKRLEGKIAINNFVKQ